MQMTFHHFYRSSRQKAPTNSNRELAGHETSERSERVWPAL